MTNTQSALEKMSDGIALLFQGISEIFSEIFSRVSKILNNIDWENIAKSSNHLEIKKYYAIYRRTKNNRIKRKQVKKIKAVLYGE